VIAIHRQHEVTRDMKAADERTPVFFLSYPRPTSKRAIGGPRTPDRRVVRFFDDLSENVSELVGLPTGATPGFIDRSMNGGEDWDDEIAWAAGTCQVFVALLSANFFRSSWCGREWEIFSRRQVQPRSRGGRRTQTAILPVLWTPLSSDQKIPEEVDRVQRFSLAGLHDPKVETRFLENGVFGLLQTRDRTAYGCVVWQLAQRIHEIHESCHVVPEIPAGPETVPIPFGGDGE
jgi:hypothetical protein